VLNAQVKKSVYKKTKLDKKTYIALTGHIFSIPGSKIIFNFSNFKVKTTHLGLLSFHLSDIWEMDVDRNSEHYVLTSPNSTVAVYVIPEDNKSQIRGAMAAFALWKANPDTNFVPLKDKGDLSKRIKEGTFPKSYRTILLDLQETNQYLSLRGISDYTICFPIKLRSNGFSVSCRMSSKTDDFEGHTTAIELVLQKYQPVLSKDQQLLFELFLDVELMIFRKPNSFELYAGLYTTNIELNCVKNPDLFKQLDALTTDTLIERGKQFLQPDENKVKLYMDRQFQGGADPFTVIRYQDEYLMPALRRIKPYIQILVSHGDSFTVYSIPFDRHNGQYVGGTWTRSGKMQVQDIPRMAWFVRN